MSEARESVLRQALPGEPVADEPTSPLLDLLPHFFETLKREPALAISLTYLLVAMGGIFYDVAFYRKFAIPVLSLAQLGDFLTAGIQQPIALVLVASTFPICWVFDRINMRHRRRQRLEIERLESLPAPTWYERLRRRYLGWRVRQVWETRLAYLAVIVAYGWLFVGFYADYRADAVKQGDAAEVRIWLNGEGGALAGSKSDRWTYLGAISSYVFVYDRAAAQATAVPVNAVARIEPFPEPPSKTHFMVAPIP
ncbi:MAG TPA: hypothetical protein VJ696_00700 [Rhodanobacteraceae bacterium]|nr:hypothetical protein [Rhodanobacteraceae bacterium]